MQTLFPAFTVDLVLVFQNFIHHIDAIPSALLLKN